MEARWFRAALVAAGLFVSLGANYRTPNFVITAPTAEFAKQVGDEAERFRRELAELWLGQPLPQWAQPCPITVEVGPNMGAGGATSFLFDRGEVFGWKMNIQGSPERVLDSVLPHEVTHTIFASHFRQPLPRWADEGACTTVEDESERQKHRRMLVVFLKTGRGIAFSQMFAMKDYPRDVMPLYAQGYSVASFLIAQGGRQKFVKFVESGLKSNRWSDTVEQHYGFQDLRTLQDSWLAWVRDGYPPLESQPTSPHDEGTMLAGARPPLPQPNLVYHDAASPTSDRVLPGPAERAVVSASPRKLVPIQKPTPGAAGVSAGEPSRQTGSPRHRALDLPWSPGGTVIDENVPQRPSPNAMGSRRSTMVEWTRRKEEPPVPEPPSR